MIPDPLPLAGLLGLMVGSFLNVCIVRIPRGESVVSPASRCPSCARPIAWFDNVPVLSYALLGGRCRHCGAHISLRYPIVEALTAAAFATQANAFESWSLLLASRLLLTALLLALAATDLETYRLPNPLTIGGTVAALALSLFTAPGWSSATLGAVIGAAVLLAIRWVWLRVTGTDGMGLGDVKMLAMVGAFLGWPQVPVVLLLSTVVGAVVGGGLAFAGRGTLQTRLPFGVFLAAAAFVASLSGQALLNWYLGLLAP